MKETEEERLAYGLLLLLTLPFILVSSLLTTYVVWDICILYNLSYLTQSGYEVFFGSILILNLFLGKITPTNKDKTVKDQFIGVVAIPFLYLLLWATAYFLHWILRF